MEATFDKNEFLITASFVGRMRTAYINPNV